MGDIPTDYNHTVNPTVTRAAVTEGTHHAPHPATTVAHATLWLTNAFITTCARTYPTGTVTSHLEQATSPTNVTHATTPHTVASLTPATITTLHEDHSQ